MGTRVASVGPIISTACLGGCASAVRGMTGPIAFTSNPPGASASMSNGVRCPSTPCTLNAAREDESGATFSKPGNMLSCEGSDFGADPASRLAGVLANMHLEKEGVVITDPATQDAVKLFGLSRQQLVVDQRDFTFHA